MSDKKKALFDSEIEAREVDQLYFQAPVALIGQAGAALLCACLYYKAVPLLHLLSWLTLMLGSLLLRWRNVQKYCERNRYAPVKSWVTAYSCHVGTSAILWCALFLYGAHFVDTKQFVYLPFIICALLAGTTIVYNSQRQIFLTFASITIVLPSIYLLVLASPDKQAFGIIGLIWLFYLTLVAAHTKKYLARSARCEIDNLNLLSELQRERTRANLMLEQLRKRQN